MLEDTKLELKSAFGDVLTAHYQPLQARDDRVVSIYLNDETISLDVDGLIKLKDKLDEIYEDYLFH